MEDRVEKLRDLFMSRDPTRRNQGLALARSLDLVDELARSMMDARGRFAPMRWTGQHRELIDTADEDTRFAVIALAGPLPYGTDLSRLVSRFPHLRALCLDRADSFAPLRDLDLHTLQILNCPPTSDLAELTSLKHVTVSSSHPHIVKLPMELESLEIHTGTADLDLPCLTTLSLRSFTRGKRICWETLPAISDVSLGDASLFQNLTTPLTCATAQFLRNDGQENAFFTLDAERIRILSWTKTPDGPPLRLDHRLEHLGTLGLSERLASLLPEMTSLRILDIQGDELAFPWPEHVAPAPALVRRKGRVNFQVTPRLEAHERMGAVHEIPGAYPQVRKISLIKEVRTVLGGGLRDAKQLAEAAADGCLRFLTERERDALVVALSIT